MEPFNEEQVAAITEVAAQSKKEDHESLIKALQKALVYPGNDRPALVARIPVICNDIRDIKNDLKWIRLITIGMAGGVGTLCILLIVSLATK